MTLATATPIRVLHLRDSPWVDGPARTILESGSHFDARRIEYHIAAFVPRPDAPHPLVNEALRRGVRAHRIVDRGGYDRGVTRQIRALVSEHRVQILHTSDVRTNLFGLLARRGGDLKLVSTAHGWIANDLRRKAFRLLDKCLMGRFDQVIAVSEATRGLLSGFVRASCVTTLHNALVIRSYGADVRDRPHKPVSDHGPLVLLNVGRLSPEKGQDLLLHAFARLRASHPRLQLWFAGTGALEVSLRDLATRLGVAEAVRFLGYINDMPALYREVDLVVQSSLTEGLPNVILEAAFLRVPIVATRVGGTAEVIEHDRSGWLIAPGSLDELITGIGTFLGDPVRFARLAEVARQRILDHFTFDARTERMTRVYEALLGR